MGEFQLAFAGLRQAIDAEGVDLAGLKQMSGVDGRDVTIAQVKNLRAAMATEMQGRADSETARAIVEAIRTSFALAECRLRRVGDERIAIVYLDGAPSQGQIEEFG